MEEICRDTLKLTSYQYITHNLEYVREKKHLVYRHTSTYLESLFSFCTPVAMEIPIAAHA